MFSNSNHNHLKAGLAISAVAASALFFAAPASALVTEEDNVKLTASGYDLGGQSFSNGLPDDPATVTWDHAWFGVIPEVNGWIHFDGQGGECARIKLVSFNQDGTTRGTPDFSNERCAGSDDHHALTVREGNFLGLTGEAGAAEVEVVLQSKNESGGWSRVTGKSRSYGPEVDSDDVLISRAELDFGDGPFTGGAPSDPGTMTWNATPTALDPVLTGTLYAKNADDLTVRMRATYRDADDDVIETRDGVPHAITDDDLHTFNVNMNDFDGGGTAFGRNTVASVKVAIQKQPTGSATWQTVGSQIVELN